MTLEAGPQTGEADRAGTRDGEDSVAAGAFGATANNGSSNPEKGDSSKIDTEEKNVGTVSGLKGNALAESGALGSKRKEGDAYDRENGSKGFRKRGRDQNSERNREDGHRYERGQDSNFRSGKHKRRKMQSGYRKVPRISDAGTRLKILLIKIGDGTPSKCPPAHVLGLAMALVKDLEKFGDLVFPTLTACAANFPTKTDVYAALIALLNQKLNVSLELEKSKSRDVDKDDTGVENEERKQESGTKKTGELQPNVHIVHLFECILKRMGESIHQLERNKSSPEFSNLLRLLFHMTNAKTLSSEGLLDFLFPLLNQYTLFPFFRNMPVVYNTLFRENEARTIELVDRMYSLANELEDARTEIAKPLLLGSENCCVSRLKNARDVLQKMQNEKHEEVCPAIRRAYGVKEIQDELVEQTQIKSLLDLKFADFNVRFPMGERESGSIHAISCVQYSLFSVAAARFKDKVRSKNPDAPISGLELAGSAIEKFTNAELFLYREQICEIVGSLYPNLSDVCNMLTWIDSPHPMEHLIVETILGMMLTLVKPDHDQLYYESLLIHLCKTSPEVYGVVVEDYVDAFLVCIREIGLDARIRFSRFFAFHLSSFGLIWPWGKWDGLVLNPKLPSNDPRKMFLKMTLERLLTLSYMEGVSLAVTNSVKTLLPSDMKPYCPLLDEETESEDGKKATQLLEFLKGKPKDEELLLWAKERLGSLNEANSKTVEILVTVALKLGSPSFTHMSKALERIKCLIVNAKEGLEDPKDLDTRIINSVSSFWSRSKQWAIFTLKRMLVMKLLSWKLVFDFMINEIANESDKDRIEWQVYEFLGDILTISERQSKESSDTSEVVNVEREPADEKAPKNVVGSGKDLNSAVTEAVQNSEHVQEQSITDVEPKGLHVSTEMSLYVQKELEKANNDLSKLLLFWHFPV